MDRIIKNKLKESYNDIYELGLLEEVTEEHLESFKNKRGVYLIVASDKNRKFIYPAGESNIIYIGMSVDLSRRLKEHQKNLSYTSELTKVEKQAEWIYSKYHYMNSFGAKVFVIKCSGNTHHKNLERNILEIFYNKYFSLPVGNGAFSFGK